MALFVLLGGSALAQEPTSMTVRVFANRRPMLTVPPDLSWGVDRISGIAAELIPPAPPARPPEEWKGPAELLLSLSEAF